METMQMANDQTDILSGGTTTPTPGTNTPSQSNVKETGTEENVEKASNVTKTPEELEEERIAEEHRRIAQEFLENNSDLYNSVLNIHQSFRMQKEKVADLVRDTEANKLSPEAQAQLQAHGAGKGGIGFLDRMRQKRQKKENDADRQKLMTLNSPEINSRMESITRNMQQFAEKGRDIQNIMKTPEFKSLAVLSESVDFPKNLNIREQEFYTDFLNKRLELSELAKESGKDIQFLKDNNALEDNVGKYVKDMKNVVDKTVNGINSNPDIQKMDAKDSSVFDKIKDNMKEMTESLVNSFKNVFSSIGNVFSKSPSI